DTERLLEWQWRSNVMLSSLVVLHAAAPSYVDTLSLHDALPIWRLDEAASRTEVEWRWVKGHAGDPGNERADALACRGRDEAAGVDRKSTRLNSSHVKISYAVFCLKKKRNTVQDPLIQRCRPPSE